MPKWSSFLTRLLLLMTAFLLGIAVVFYGLSNYFFRDAYSGVSFGALREGMQQARHLLADYAAGALSREDLHAAVNPALSTDGGFFMLLDGNQQVLAYTESAAPYFAGSTLSSMLAALQEERSTSSVQRADGHTRVYLMGERTEEGYVLVGKPTRIFRGVASHFSTRLFLSMAVVMAVLMIISAFTARRAARPARLITEMAGRLTDGEQVLVPENLPGKDMQEIAGALNYMSRTVAKAIQDLQNEKETMAMILEGLNEGILAIDREGSILHENAAAWRLLGGEETAAYHSVMAALKEEHPESHWEQKFAAGDRMLYYGVSRLPAEDGQSRGTVALIRDITEQERLERTRHDYVANISHELRTPLSSIRGLGEGLRDGMVTEERDRQRYYNIIVDEAQRLSRLVNDLLELSSLQSNPAAFEMEKVDPNELIYDLHDRNGSLFTEKGIAFERSLPDTDLPVIVSNEDRLSQVLTIFLDNARKYTPSGGRVTLGAEMTAQGVRFFVRDTGIGMDTETQSLAFERFHQAERSRSDQGSGLGLSIAREVLDKMGVSIRVDSAPGEGSEFSFIVPEKPNSEIALS